MTNASIFDPSQKNDQRGERPLVAVLNMRLCSFTLRVNKNICFLISSVSQLDFWKGNVQSLNRPYNFERSSLVALGTLWRF